MHDESLRRLDVFTGRWHAEGESYGEGQQTDSPRASAVPWISDETYEWLPGGFFLLHRWDASVGERPFRGTEVIGYDEALGCYFTRFFDDAGNHPEYRAHVDGNVWTLTGDATRARVTVSDDGRQMALQWEWRNDGKDWLPLCDRVARRVAGGDDPEAEIREIVEERVSAVRTRNVVAATARLASDVHTFDVVNPLQRRGLASLAERAGEWFSSFEGPIEFEMRDLTIVAGQDTAFSHSLNRYSGSKTDGGRIDMWVRATTGYRRVHGRWMIAHEHSSVPFDAQSGKASLDLEP